jgi:hypothetical protein
MAGIITGARGIGRVSVEDDALNISSIDRVNRRCISNVGEQLAVRN